MQSSTNKTISLINELLKKVYPSNYTSGLDRSNKHIIHYKTKVAISLLPKMLQVIANVHVMIRLYWHFDFFEVQMIKQNEKGLGWV